MKSSKVKGVESLPSTSPNNCRKWSQFGNYQLLTHQRNFRDEKKLLPLLFVKYTDKARIGVDWMDDFSLVRKCLEGDSNTYRHIVERYKDQIARVIYSMIGSKTEVEDLTQEVFIKAYRSLDTFKFDSSFNTWLYRIAVNHTIDHLRKTKLTRLLSLDGIDEWVLGKLRGTRHAQERVPDEITRAEAKELVQWALSKLSHDSRTVIVLREFEDLSYDEISNVLGISVAAVKSRLFRARAELKKILTPALRGEA